MTSRVLIEVCVDSLEGALAAHRGGADRIELCAGLSEGGLTPGPGTIRHVRELLRIPVHVLIRPKPGDFLYSADEFEAMRRDVEFARQWGADGAVFGILREDGSVDEERTAELLSLARPMSVTFHRAFDVSSDPFRTMDVLIALGVERILTSGQKATAVLGADLIRELVLRSEGRIAIMAGGGLNEGNVRSTVERTGVREIHASGRSLRDSGMRHRNPDVHMGVGGSSEYQLPIADPNRIRAMRRALEGVISAAFEANQSIKKE
jgi:copper homeostasis protein